MAPTAGCTTTRSPTRSGSRRCSNTSSPFPGGRYQALSVAWDTRPKAAGGQRWFHLYPGEKVDHRDVLHWTGVAQNWNFMCADCHSTNLQKRYDAASDTFDTTWSEINVSCEACHGPGSRHVEWARRAKAAGGSGDALKGLVFSMKDTSGGHWALPAGAAIARRTAPLSSRLEVETCGRCHARAARLWPTYEHGRPLADTHRVALLEEGLYEADGQIRDEVYEYGSFLQSKMYQAGVTCSNCHDPHSSALRLPGNALCGQCHVPTRYDQPTHHFHQAGTAGAQCVSCHMPQRRYMVVDDRRDHSFRIPRPDESVRLGTPNTCTACHSRRSGAWAAAAVQKWYGPAAAARPSFAAAFHAGRTRQPEGASLLSSLVADRAQPPIVRATALSLLSRYAGARNHRRHRQRRPGSGSARAARRRRQLERDRRWGGARADWRPAAGRPRARGASRCDRGACRGAEDLFLRRRTAGLRRGRHRVPRGAARQRRSRRVPRESRHARGAAWPPARGRGRLARGDCAAAAVRARHT